jgi:Caspase domain
MADERIALVVAVDRYDHPALHRLAAPAADAAALAHVLGNPALGGFHVKILSNPTSWEAAEKIEQLFNDRHPTDLVLLHFSCHGLKDDSGELYLAARNTRPHLLRSTAVEATWVNRVMQRSRAQKAVLLLDCCYGGAFERGVVARAAATVDVGDQFNQQQLGAGRGRVIITASTAMQYAFDGPKVASGKRTPSVFTGALVEGIRTGDADLDQNGRVTLGELYDYVHGRVVAQTPHQTPSKWEFGVHGDLYVALNPHAKPSTVAAANAVATTTQPSAGGSAKVSKSARPQRTAAGIRTRRPLLSSLAIATVVVLAAILGGWAISTALSRNHTPGSSATSPPVSYYDTLSALLPATLRGTCHEGDVAYAKALSEAHCGAGTYRLWNKKSDLYADLNPDNATPGSCAKAPTGSIAYSAALLNNRPGVMTCNQVWPTLPESRRYYCIRWAVENRLISAQYCSKGGSGPSSYPPLYQQAEAVLAQLP